MTDPVAPIDETNIHTLVGSTVWTTMQVFLRAIITPSFPAKYIPTPRSQCRIKLNKNALTHYLHVLYRKFKFPQFQLPSQNYKFLTHWPPNLPCLLCLALAHWLLSSLTFTLVQRLIHVSIARTNEFLQIPFANSHNCTTSETRNLLTLHTNNDP